MGPIRIAKVDTRLQRTAYGAGALLLALPFIAIGVFFTLAGFGTFDLPGKVNGPVWLIGAMGFAFALGGGVLAGHAILGLLLRRRAAVLRRRFAGQPWFLDYPWAPEGVVDSPSERWLTPLLGMLLMAAIVVPFNWLAFFSRDANLLMKGVTGLFDVALLLVFGAFLYRFVQAVKFGRSRLSFARFPFQPGEELEVGLSPNRFRRLRVTLRYVEEWFERTGRGRQQSVSHRTVSHWSESREISTDPHLAEVPVRFRLPDEPDWVDQLTADPKVRYWELVVESDQPGIDFRTTFPLPVYDRRGVAAQSVPRGAPLAGGRLARLPYGFELGVPLLLATVILGAWFMDPAATARVGERMGGLWQYARVKVLLRPVEEVGRSAMAAARSPDGRVWLLDKYQVVRAGAGGLEILLDPARYQGAFGHKVNALSALLPVGREEAYVGSWYGELFHYAGGRWRELSARDEPLGQRIHSLAHFGGALYLATRVGLWHWKEGEGLLRVEALPLVGAVAVARTDEALYAGIGNQVWRLGPGGWRLHWQGAAADREVTALLGERQGLWIGTQNGLISLRPDGMEEHRTLPGLHVTALHRFSQGLLVGTWGAGLRIESPGGWRVLGESEGLPDGDVTDLALDGEGRLWVTLYGAGAVPAPLSSLTAAAR